MTGGHEYIKGKKKKKKLKKVGNLMLVRSTLAKLHFNVSQNCRVHAISILMCFCKIGVRRSPSPT